MARIREATVDDLYREHGKAELVNGELVIVTPGGGTHGYAAGAIHASLFDYAERAMAVKRTDYFAAGTLVVWDVDLEAPLVRVYRSTDPTSPTTYRQGGRAEAEPAVPAWSMPVDELFPPA